MHTQYKTNATDFFNTHPEIRDLLATRRQAVLSDDCVCEDIVLLAKSDYENLIWTNYVDAELQKAETLSNRPDAKKYTIEEFFEKVRQL